MHGTVLESRTPARQARGGEVITGFRGASRATG